MRVPFRVQKLTKIFGNTKQARWAQKLRKGLCHFLWPSLHSPMQLPSMVVREYPARMNQIQILLGHVISPLVVSPSSPQEEEDKTRGRTSVKAPSPGRTSQVPTESNT